jgi:hypothetical protein
VLIAAEIISSKRNKIMSNGFHKKTIAFLAIFLAFFVYSGTICLATGASKALSGLEQSSTQAYGTLPEKDISKTIGKVVGVGLSFVGVLFLALLIYGGFTWMFARGNQQDVQKAKDIMEAAVIGLIIVMAAYAITAYVGSVLTS